jgi:hypothetical protein
MRTLSIALLLSSLSLLAGCGDAKSGAAASASAVASAPAAPAKPAGPAPVTNPDMDPRVVEPCVSECRGKASPGSPDYLACFNPCKQRKAAEINGQ